ncbi:MAG: ribonuclease J [Minisyncoccia bacterium]
MENKQKFLKIIPLGGLGEVGRNMTIFEFEEKILIVDMGLKMPEESTPGIDYIIPNSVYLKGKENNILGLICTHGHLDHIGAIPYTIHRIGNPPIFTSKLTKALILKRQEDFPQKTKLDIKEVKPGDEIDLFPFKILFFKQTHNIPENLGLVIKTPVGNILHTSDFKFDQNPINDTPTDFENLKELAKLDILILMSDSTGAENEGHSLSEQQIFENLEKIFIESKGRIIVSTFASHINRITQIISLSEKYGRKVFVAGKSMKDNVEIARNLKYIKTKKGTFQKIEDINKFEDEKITLLCTGAQGEPDASLMKITSGEFKFFQIKNGDTVIFSSSVIPGNERSVQNLKDNLYRQGAKVYHYQMMDIHASGHAYQEELKEMIKIIKPKFFIPIHGQYSMLIKNIELAQEVGLKPENTICAENGQVIIATENKVYISKEKVQANYVMVDGLGIGDVGEVVLRDRQALAKDGIFVIIAAIERETGRVKTSPDIISRGFVYLRESKELLKEVRKLVIKIIERASVSGGAVNWTFIKEEIKEKVGAFLFHKTKRRPMVISVIIEV